MAASSRTRLPPGSLNREVILDGALRTLARPGATGLTMRALAEELSADPTAVYRHFDGKAALLGALTDHLLRPVCELERVGGWRAELEALGLALRQVFDRFPGAVAVIAESPFTPMTLRALEEIVAALIDDELPAARAAEATQAVVLYAIGHAASSLSADEGFWAELFDLSIPADELPALHATAAVWRAPARQQFGTGLALLLDGIDRAAG